jgi:hypothetical protein
MAKGILMSPEEVERRIFAEGLKTTMDHHIVRSTRTSPPATDGVESPLAAPSSVPDSSPASPAA